MTHRTPCRRRTTKLAAIAGSLALLASAQVAAADQAAFHGTLRTETTDSPPVEVPFWVAPGRLRMDVSLPMNMTVIWTFGSEPSLAMIRHGDRTYVEWGPEQLEGARRIARAAPQRAPAADAGDLRFEATGATATIDAWDAVEIRLSSDVGEDGRRLWVSRDAGYGLAEFFAHYANALQGTTQFPMVGTENDPLGLSSGVSLPLDQLDRASGLDGRIVRIVDSGGTREAPVQTTITLHSLEQGPVDAGVFAVPEGYARKAQLSSNVL